MEMKREFEFIGPSIYIKKYETLIIGDLHIGSEQALAESGVLSPIIGLSEISEITYRILKKIKPRKIILLGDLEVHFGYLPFNQKEAILNFLKTIKENSKEVILIRGNHDKAIGKIIEKINLKFVNSYQLQEYFFCHGHEIPKIPKNSEYIMIGHEHPAISITNNIRIEKFKCFIVSKFRNRELIVLPSINQTSIGTDVSKEKLLSPFLTKSVLKHAKVYLVEDMKVYDFGNLFELNKLKGN